MNLKHKQFIDSYIGIPLVYFHILLAKSLGFLLRRDHSIKKEPNEICFIKLLGYGSVVMASDAIFSIRKKYPVAKISIICSHSIQEGIHSMQLFDSIYVIDDRSFLKIFFSSFKIISGLAVKKRLWTVDLEVYSKMTSVLALWTMAINRFGFYFNEVSFRDRLNTHNVYFNNLINVTENYYQMGKALGVSNFSQYSFPGYPPREKEQVFGYIAVNNTCSEFSPERKMSESQLYHICKWVVNQTPYKIALLGAPSDKIYNLDFISRHNTESGSFRNIAGEMPMNDYYSFLYNECALLVTIDSAPLHIAHKLNIPTVSVWGPTAPQSRVSESADHLVVYQPVPCSPCAHFINKLPCGGDNFCIKNISGNTIIHAIQKVLE